MNAKSAAKEMSLSSLESKLAELTSGVEVDANAVSRDINAAIDITMDATDAGNIINAIDSFTIAIVPWELTASVHFVTPGPSVSPTIMTQIPRTSPSATGIVVTMTLTSADREFDATELSDLQSTIADYYG